MVRSADIIDELDVSTATVHRWVRDGVLRPVEGGGSGYPFRFTADEVAIARVLSRFRVATLEPAASQLVATTARAQLGENPAAAVVVDFGNGVMLMIGPEA